MSALSSSSMASDNLMEKLATFWLEFKKPLVPIWRFLTSHTQDPPRNASLRFPKLGEYVDSPWTWGAIGILAGAIGQSVSLAWVFFVAWALLSFQVIRVRSFGGTARAVKMLSILFTSALIGAALWGVWRIVPKPQPPSKPATAAEIAAEVSKILPKGGGGASTKTITETTHGSPPDLSVVFKDSPLLTPERRRRITSGMNSFYLYLKSLG